jgi:hypothetical protein
LLSRINCKFVFDDADVKEKLLEKGYAQTRMESFLSQKDAKDRADFNMLSQAMQQELNRENRSNSSPFAILDLLQLALLQSHSHNAAFIGGHRYRRK